MILGATIATPKGSGIVVSYWIRQGEIWARVRVGDLTVTIRLGHCGASVNASTHQSALNRTILRYEALARALQG